MSALFRIRIGEFRGAILTLAIAAACWLLPGFLLPAGVSGQENFRIDTFDAHYGRPTSCAVRPQDQVWLVNSRELARHDCPAESLKIYQACDQVWCRTDLTSFIHHQPDGVHRETVIFVHGHHTNLMYAQVRGWQAYQALVGGNRCAPPVRFVIWAWPSDTEHQNHLQSLHKSDLHGFFLARLLFRLDPSDRVSLFGYSLGARVVLGALQLANGGLVDGHGIAECGQYQLSPYRVTLVAPAINCDCMATGNTHERACGLIDRLQLVYNSSDIVLKLYRLADRDHHQPALGILGITSSTQCSNAISIQQCNARQLLHKRHSIVYYWAQSSLVQQMRCFLFSD